MTFALRPAIREKIGLLFGIAGASGSGKTFSALMLARGIAGAAGKIAVIDTEAGRSLHYAPKPGEKGDNKTTFDFLHLDFQPPFTPDRYIKAIRVCEDAGMDVILIDSMSHEWAGEGGCADMQLAEATRMATDRKTGEVQEWRIEAMTAPAWKKPKAMHQHMMSRLIQTRTHLIFCLRAQEKIKIVKKANGPGTEIVPIGFQPICEKSFMFELSGSMVLSPENPGAPDYNLPHKLNADLQRIFPDGKCIGPDAGARLRQWADTGADRPPPQPIRATTPDHRPNADRGDEEAPADAGWIVQVCHQLTTTKDGNEWLAVLRSAALACPTAADLTVITAHASVKAARAKAPPEIKGKIDTMLREAAMRLGVPPSDYSPGDTPIEG